ASRVLITGPLNHSQIPVAIAASDLCVAPFSHGRNDMIEVSPLKIFEYMAMARPVVASNVPGIREIVQDAGVVIDPENVGALAEAVSALLANPARREQMSRVGFEIASRASWQSRAKSILSVINELLPNPRGIHEQNR